MPRSVARLLPPTVVSAALRQVAAVAAIGAIGTTAFTVAGVGGAGGVTTAARSGPAPAPKVVAAPQPLPVPLRLESRVPALAAAPPAAPAAPATAHPARVPAAAKPVAHPRTVHRSVRPVRWLPTGTGMWIYEWRRTDHGRPAAVVSHARRTGLTHLFVRTGSTHDGYTGAPTLAKLLPATRRTGLRVVAWDFPELKHPVRDAKRLARAAWFNRHGTSSPHVAAVAPDIETPSEGTRTTVRRVHAYLATLRRLLPRDVAILATVPWPSQSRRGHYPYGTVASLSDALLPMAYWYNNPPRLVTQRSMSFLSRFHKPVQPVGQGYDGHKEWHWLPHNNLRRQVPAFFQTAHRMGAKAVSLWSWQSAPRDAWLAISRYRGWFAKRR